MSEFRGGAGLLVAAPGVGRGASHRFKIRFVMSDVPRQRGLSTPCISTGTPPCAPGTVINPSGFYIIRETTLSPVAIDGVRYFHLYVAADLDFTGESVVVPDSQESAVLLSAPVVMTGSIMVTRPSGFPTIFEGQVSARGRATLRLKKVEGGYRYERITYFFEDPATAPPLSLRAWLEATTKRVGQTLGRAASKAQP